MTDGPDWCTAAIQAAERYTDDITSQVTAPAATKIGAVVQVTDQVYDDNILAFRAFAGPQIGVSITDDPLGTVNKIVRFTRNGEPAGPAVLYPSAKLYPVRGGAEIKVGTGPSIHTPADTERWRMFALWRSVHYIEIDGTRILEVGMYDLEPPLPPRPPIPLRRRIRTAYDRRQRAVTDAIARRFGYVHEDSIGDDW